MVIEGPGTLIGPYKLLEQIGEGGFGVVFMAEQQHPIRRRVALKVVKPGMDTRQVVARFEAERQALALMEHPNIAHVLEGGETTTGRPFFVMELVRGVPITEFCDRHQLSVVRRLELFATVCEAVQHAHQKGIIHRDLKPSNVLVTLHDGTPLAKVIDFGVAKAMGQQLTEKTLFTNFAQMIGTPLYMSPEQAELSGLDIDTRSDVYSLGVLLYELSTGTTPFDRERMKTAAFDEIRRIIREEEPAKPSTRISTLRETASIATANRRSDPARLQRLLRGELDWIVMKCLEKDRTRRYETASVLARDIRRYLNGEPVEAGPPSASYRFRKLVHKHRKLFTAAAAFLLLLITGTVVSIWQANAERLAKESAQKRLAQIEKSNEILGSIFRDLDPRAEEIDGRPLRVLLGERLEQAVQQLEGEAVGDPLAVARLQMTLGSSLLGLGNAELATAVLTRARDTFTAQLGPDDTDTLTCMNHLAWCHRTAGRLDVALPMLEENLRRTREKLGADHPDTLNRVSSLALGYRAMGRVDLAIPLLEQALEGMKARLGTSHSDTLAVMTNLGWCYQQAGDIERAVELLNETLALSKSAIGEDHPSTLVIMSRLSAAYRTAGQLELAVPLLEKTLERRREKLGPEHPHTLTSMNNLAAAYLDAGQLDRALPLFEETLKLMKRRLGADHPDTLTSMAQLATAYRSAGKLELALPLLEEAFARMKEKLGADHPDTLTAMGNLGRCYQQAGNLDRAVALLEETLKLCNEKLGPEHPHSLAEMNNLASAYCDAGKLNLALPLFEESLERVKAKLGPDHPDALVTAANLAQFYGNVGKRDLALPLFEKTLEGLTAKLGPEHPTTLAVVSNLAALYDAVGRREQAVTLSERAATAVEKRNFRHQEAGTIIDNVSCFHEELNQYREAELWRRKWTTVLKERVGPHSLECAAELALLGWNLIRQEKWSEAEQVVSDCVEIREVAPPPSERKVLGSASEQSAGIHDAQRAEARLPTDSARALLRCLERLARFYEQQGDVVETEHWREEWAAEQARQRR
jgi:serine/threonine protein kinase/Tfp pilus assembly protein PilF